MFCGLSFACFIVATLSILSTAAHDEAYHDSGRYNAGQHGDYVEQRFVSTKVTAPKLNFMRPFRNCNDGTYLFLAPRGSVMNSSVCILDATGSLVWTSSDFEGQGYNLQVQQYLGKDYLTFWAGDNSLGGGHGDGKHYMGKSLGRTSLFQAIHQWRTEKCLQLDQNYNLFRTITAANGLATDLHSFSITPAGTALLTVYEVIEADLSGVPLSQGGGRPILANIPFLPPSDPSFVGPKKGYVWDSVFQEIDLETGKLLFQWRASDHFAYQQSYEPIRSATQKESWDWFHINSVDKDDTDNYLISARHLRTVANIDGRTGEVLWQLGGRSGSFKDRSAGTAIQYIGQHDAHWAPGSNQTAITMFDNRADWSDHQESQSRGTRIHLDFESMTATLVTQYKHTENVYSVSQGSYQTLPNGNVLLGYGNNPVLTEFAANGTILCDAYFGPSKGWTSGNVQSYRALKFEWVGLPTGRPSLVIKGDTLYVSWLGSTEVRSWLIQHSTRSSGKFEALTTIAKDGFETSFIPRVGAEVRQYVQVLALDKARNILAVSDTVNLANATWSAAGNGLGPQFETDYEYRQLAKLSRDLQRLLLFFGLALPSSCLLCWLCLGVRTSRSFHVVRSHEKRSDDTLWARPQARCHELLADSKPMWTSVIDGKRGFQDVPWYAT
ncbi:hypothetical protein LTR56_007199 [Elasticomyces elasticus]|nr:hypothetical protein LTR22_014396 [Elasticomyces elasticus]KAK3649067.1 hypothetical protein LTR56_007199 [Elasticomyces elasticus]KAK5752236.1 hypothetical protein LTS12_017733 [Elasticomyces elasticus]